MFGIKKGLREFYWIRKPDQRVGGFNHLATYGIFTKTGFYAFLSRMDEDFHYEFGKFDYTTLAQLQAGEGKEWTRRELNYLM